MQARFAPQRKDVFALSNYFVIYERDARVKYVSHLDFVRMFGRAIRRAQIPIAFSEGFNPHALLTFALPLPVGHTSECEILEITLKEDMACEKITDALNKVLPLGVRIKETREGKSGLKKLSYALYTVKAQNLPEDVTDFLNMKEILIDKKTKSGIRETDILPDIKSLKITDGALLMLLCAGSRANLKPDVVISAMNRHIPAYESGECEFHRIDILNDEMISLVRRG